MVRDPQFWKRFSVAVHQDDLEKTAHTQDPKHSYVRSPLSSPPPGSPTSQTHLHQPSTTTTTTTTFPPMAQLPSTRSSFAAPSPLSAQLSASQVFESCDEEMKDKAKTKTKTKTKNPQRTRSKLQKTPSTKPLLRPTISIQEDLDTSTSFSPHHHHDTQPLPSAPPSRPHSLFFRTPNLSTLSLSLSGRPSSRFHFSTTITADASHRDSWLASQQRKARQRTWICWLFWIGLLGLVAGVVVAVLVLKRKGII